MAVVFKSGPVENASLLIPERVVPVASPHLKADLSGLERLIYLDSRKPVPWMSWEAYLERAGKPKELASRKGNLRFNTYSLVIDAAREGQGIALGWRGLVDPLLQRGELVSCGCEIESEGRGYYLIHKAPANRASHELRDWLVSEAASAMR